MYWILFTIIYIYIYIIHTLYNGTGLCDKYNPIVCCLQETMLTKDDLIIRGFNCIHLTSRDIGGRACGGVSVLLRDGIHSS